MSTDVKFKTRHADLVRNVKATCLRYGIPEPDEFLAEVMAGRDPRRDVSELFDCVRRIEDGRVPDSDEWEEIRNLVLTDPAYRPARVTANTSIAAATKLVDHLYPKLKALEVTQETTSIGAPAPLTDDEISRFKRALENDDSF